MALFECKKSGGNKKITFVTNLTSNTSNEYFDISTSGTTGGSSNNTDFYKLFNGYSSAKGINSTYAWFSSSDLFLTLTLKKQIKEFAIYFDNDINHDTVVPNNMVQITGASAEKTVDNTHRQAWYINNITSNTITMRFSNNAIYKGLWQVVIAHPVVNN